MTWAVAVVGLVTVTKAKAPAAAPLTDAFGPKLAIVAPCTKFVYWVVMAIAAPAPGGSVAGLSDTMAGGGLTVSDALVVLANVIPVEVRPVMDTRYGVGAVTAMEVGI